MAKLTLIEHEYEFFQVFIINFHYLKSDKQTRIGVIKFQFRCCDCVIGIISACKIRLGSI